MAAVLATGLLLAISGSARAQAPQPPVTAGLQLWYEAERESYADGAPVDRWLDRSGFGRDLTAANDVAEPAFRDNAVNGRAAIEFNGVRSLLKTYEDSFTLSQPTTFFVAFKSLDVQVAGERDFLLDSRNSLLRQAFGRSAPNTVRMYATNDFDVGGIAYPFESFQIWSGTYNGAQSSMHRNNALLANGSAGNDPLSGGLTVGGLNTGSGEWGYDYGKSLVAEILYYTGAMSAADRQAVTAWLNEKYAAFGPPVAPANTALPVVTGTPSDGSALSASTGTWTGSQPINYAYRWRRCDSAGANCTDIASATQATYTVTPADVGSRLRVVVTGSNSVGASSATSVATAVVTGSPPVNTTAPSIAGTAREGLTLTGARGTWAGTTPLDFTQVWERCSGATGACAPIAGASGLTYTATAADVGSTLRFTVTASNASGSASASSARTVQVTAAATGGGSSPPVTANLQVWFEAESESYADGAAVTRWSDRSGFGRDLTAVGAVAAPAFRDNAVNGRAAIEFNGVRSLMKTYEDAFTLPQPTTFFIAYRSIDSPSIADVYVLDSRNSLNRQVFGRGRALGQQEMYAGTDLLANGITYPFPSFEIWSGTYNGAQSSMHRNNTQLVAGQAGSDALAEGLAVGALSTGTGEWGYNYGKSLVAEILYYTGTMSTADRQAVTLWLNEKYAAFGPPVAPTNTAPPEITGNPRDGSVLSAGTGTWSGSQPLTYSYRWRRCTSGGSCADIAGATQSTYAVTPADIGSQLVVAVTAANSVGNSTATSAQTAAVTAAPPANTAAPSISGVAREGATLTADRGSWTGTAPLSYAYAWERCAGPSGACSPISAANATTYVPTAADVGSTMRVTVTASNSAGSQAASSARTATVAPAGGDGGGGQPPVTAGLELWFDASQETYLEGGLVTRWADRSGFGRDLTASDTLAAPMFRANTVNGRDAIEFDGVRSLLKTYEDTFSLPQPTTFFIVYRSLEPGSAATETHVLDSLTPVQRQSFGRAGQNVARMYATNDMDASPVTYPFPKVEVWSGTYSGAQSSMHRNGQLLRTGNPGSDALGNGLAVGALSASGIWGYEYSKSLVAEVLYYSGALSTADMQSVTGWLNQKYAAF